MKILLIDDEPLARNELSYLLKEAMTDLEIYEAATIAEGVDQLLLQEPAIVFLDIHLTNESGLTLANKINKMAKSPLVIFATAYDNYAVKAFELDAQDYLVKPFELSRVTAVLAKAVKRLTEEPVPTKRDLKEIEDIRLPVKTKERIYLVPSAEIITISVANGVTEINTPTQKYTILEPLNGISEKLPCQRFLRVHRSYLINLFEISEIQPWFNQTLQVTMSNGDKVPISRSYLSQFKERVGLT
ncbi:LytTR family transcriptional regulator DNA-binding domain-containing protein [Vagococcus salmoninarum]|uniref:LytTR family transcriptional regulator DNA-binding domain-containing protein n=1 Tax=Vagococcus salmoninarum TaxID=2739 RepID=UPI003F9C994C